MENNYNKYLKYSKFMRDIEDIIYSGPYDFDKILYMGRMKATDKYDNYHSIIIHNHIILYSNEDEYKELIELINASIDENIRKRESYYRRLSYMFGVALAYIVLSFAV